MSAAAVMFAGPQGVDLRRRMLQATAEARELLDLPADPDSGADPGQLPDLIAGLRALLAGGDGDGADALEQEHEAALERLRHRFDTRSDALARAGEAVNRLRETTSPAAMLGRAPAALCQSSNFERALLSVVSAGRMVGEAAHLPGDPGGAERVVQELAATPIRLEHPLIETELLRRRRATIVVDAAVHPRVDRRLCELMGWSSYAAAPLVAGGQVIGVLHADRGTAGRLDVLDRDVLWEFASTLAQAYESASLMRTLRQEREQMRQFLDWLNVRSSELTDAPIRLATVQRPPRRPLSIEGDGLPLGGRDDRVVFEGLLTRRELDVLRLLADGQTNKSIADALVISGGTVKFHVNSILRKLHVANRAEAVSRYLRLLGMHAP
jgi:LuxR family transcriptional regulator, regulator of acetate metabolism